MFVSPYDEVEKSREEIFGQIPSLSVCMAMLVNICPMNWIISTY